MTVCEVIMIRYGLPDLEQECVDSVIEHTTDVDYHLTDHDNYDADEGLSKVWNDLIRASDAEYICLLNNDTRVEAGWLSKMLEGFEDSPTLGCVGPMTNASTGPQGNARLRTKEKNLIPTRYPLVGFCLVFPKYIWEEVGGFDEEYEIYGEDSDFCMEVRELGYEWRIRTDVFIFHHGKASTSIAIDRGKDLLALKKESKARYLAKWKSGKLTPAQEAVHEEKRLAIEEKRLAIEEEKKKKAIKKALTSPQTRPRTPPSRNTVADRKREKLARLRAAGSRRYVR